MSMQGENNVKPNTILDGLFDKVSHREWEALANKSLRGEQHVQQLFSQTLDGLPIHALYDERPSTTKGLVANNAKAIDNRLALLGVNTELANETILNALQLGITSVELSVETTQGFNLTQLDKVLNAVHVNMAAVSVHAGEQFEQCCEQLELLWHAQAVDASQVNAAINADPIATLVSTGVLNTSLSGHLTQLGLMAKRMTATYPKVSAVCVNTSAYHNAGATAVQELVAALATASLYMDAMLNAGLSADDAAQTITFQIACDANYLQNVVKLRVFQQLWQHVSGLYGAAATAANIVAETSQRYLSCREPWINHLRNISAASAALMGNAQTLIVHPHNRINGIRLDNDTETADRVARNIAIILEQEAALAKVNDPMAGAFGVESLTQSLMDASWAALIELENNGGLIAQLEKGEWQAAIANSQSQRVKLLEEETQIAIGVNRFTQGALPSNDIILAVNEASSARLYKGDAGNTAHAITPLIPQRDATSFETPEAA